MESAAIAGLAASLWAIRATTICLIIANRANRESLGRLQTAHEETY